ncbi:Formin 11 [Hibiscus trionum]|nr:Formin 11 [Hibiscus trionum]
MGFGFQILQMIFIIFILQSSLILIADALMEDAAEGFKVDGNENRIEIVSGQDENGVKEASIVLKFRALLGLKSAKTRTLNGAGECLSPSPSPSPPAPSPAMPKVVRFRPRLPRSSMEPQPYRVRKGNADQGRVKRILVPVLVSAGAVSLACVLGVLCFCCKIKKYKMKSKKTGRIKGESKCLSSQDPSLDLFYLNSLGVSLEQQHACLKQSGETEKTSSNRRKEVGMRGSDNGADYSTMEITSVHRDVDSSDNESFHSFVDSNSPNARLSNASAVGLNGDTKISPSVQHSPGCQKNSTLPPPPPPPIVLVLPLYSTSPAITTMTPKTSSPSTLLNETPSRNSDSSLGPVDGPFSPRIASNALPSPPSIPPPPQLPQYSPIGKDGTPLPKLKPLHWDKVRATPDRSMVWDKLRSSSFELDEEMIESLFGYNIQNPMKNDEAKSKTPSPSKHVLEPKRLQNITILLKALNVTSEQACNALMKGNGLVLQQLEALVRMVPTKEEEDKLYGFKGDINDLGSAEKFVTALLRVPFAFLRAEAMLYRETFDDEVIHLKSSFSMLEEACRELRSSRLFLKLLEAVLKTGNRMNVGTVRGGARAFKLDALLKLADVKGTDGKTTLLHFVVQEIVRSEGMRVSNSIMGKINQRNKSRTAEEQEEDYRRMGLDLVSGLSTELHHVKKTATVDLDVLASSVSNLSDGKAKLQHLVRVELWTDEKSGDFVGSMNSFLDYAEKNLKEVEGNEHEVLLHVREIREYFHGDVSKVDEANPLRIFVIVRDFLGMLDHVCKELRNFKVPSSPTPLAPFR